MRGITLGSLAMAALVAGAPASAATLVIGSATGVAQVQVYQDPSVPPVLSFQPYGPTSTGGVAVAAGDVTGDGVADIVTGSGAGESPLVRVFSGADGSPVRSFFAYDPVFLGGVRTGTGDVTGDGIADILTGPGAGGGPNVKVFNGVTGDTVFSFFAFETSFVGGVRVASGDVNGDGRADIIVGAGSGSTQVKIFDAATLAPLYSFIPFGSGIDGVTVATGRFAGVEALFVGAGAGGPPAVNIYRLSDLTQITSLLAFAPAFTGGVSVAAGTFGGGDALYAGTLSGGGELVVFAAEGRVGSELGRFTPFGQDYTGGLNLAAAVAVPEPATWAMMIAGFGMAGGAMRRRLRVAAA